MGGGLFYIFGFPLKALNIKVQYSRVTNQNLWNFAQLKILKFSLIRIYYTTTFDRNIFGSQTWPDLAIFFLGLQQYSEKNV